MHGHIEIPEITKEQAAIETAEKGETRKMVDVTKQEIPPKPEKKSPYALSAY